MKKTNQAVQPEKKHTVAEIMCYVLTQCDTYIRQFEDLKEQFKNCCITVKPDIDLLDITENWSERILQKGWLALEAKRLKDRFGPIGLEGGVVVATTKQDALYWFDRKIDDLSNELSFMSQSYLNSTSPIANLSKLAKAAAIAQMLDDMKAFRKGLEEVE